MKLINIYLVGLFHVLKPTKYMVWNNEIISWRLCLLCMDAGAVLVISKISEFWIECVYAIAYFADGGDMSNI